MGSGRSLDRKTADSMSTPGRTEASLVGLSSSVPQDSSWGMFRYDTALPPKSTASVSWELEVRAVVPTLPLSGERVQQCTYTPRDRLLSSTKEGGTTRQPPQGQLRSRQ